MAQEKHSVGKILKEALNFIVSLLLVMELLINIKSSHSNPSILTLYLILQ